MVNPLTNPLDALPLPLGNLMIAAAKVLADRLNERLADAGFADLRASHAPVFMGMAAEGTRLGVLAERAAMTKQSMGELVKTLTSSGYVEVVPDPNDARARIVTLTGRGWAAVETAVAVITEYESWLDAHVGARRVAELRETLGLIIDQAEG